jgi:hypothetical protein
LLLEADIKNTCFYAVWFSVTLRASLDTISEVFGALSEKIEKKWSTSIMLVERGEVCHPGRTKEQELKSCKQAMHSELKDSAQEMTSRMRKVMEPHSFANDESLCYGHGNLNKPSVCPTGNSYPAGENPATSTMLTVAMAGITCQALTVSKHIRCIT